MTNNSSDEFAAKLDVYENEASFRNDTSDKTTFVLENVTSIHPAKSKTHINAFEIVERHPVLVLSGCSDLESYSWMLTLQQILTPGQIEVKKDFYQVTVSNNEHSKKWCLSGDMILNVSPTCISLVDKTNVCIVSWGLSTLKKFDVQKESVTGMMNILVIECGPNSPTGQSCFRFMTDEAQDILKAIRQSICLALEQKQNARRAATPRQRAISVTVSEKSFQHLLENNPVFADSRDRSGSDSSNSTTCTNTGTSPTYSFTPAMVKQEMINSSFRQRSAESGSGVARPVSDLEALVEGEETSHGSVIVNELNSNQGEKKESGHKRQNSHPSKLIKDGGYSVIRDVELPARVRRNTFSAESFEISDGSVTVKHENVNTDSSLLDDIDSRFDSSIQLSKSDRYARYKEQHHGSPFTTMTFPRTSIDTSTLPRDPGMGGSNGATPTSSTVDSTRKRSNSTGDIQGFHKHRTKESKTENDYEELDELRASVQKIIRSKKMDSPPELPARPSSKSFSQQNLDLSGSLKKKRFTFKRPLSQNKKDSSQKATNSNKCTCGDFRSKGRQFMPGIGPCIVCGGATSDPNLNPARSIIKSLSNEELIGSTHSSLSDLYMSIPDVNNTLTKRRRSSDTTPVSSFLSLPGNLTDSFNTTERLLTSSQGQAEPTNQFSADPLKWDATAQTEIVGTMESNTGDPLLLFESSPPLQPPSQVSPSNLDLLTSLAGFPESPPLPLLPQPTTSPLAGHFVYSPIQNHHQVLVPENNFSGNFWGEAPSSFQSPFSHGYHNSGSHMGQVSPQTGHYIPMSYNCVGNGFVHGDAPDITEQLESLTFHDDNVYVQPSGLHDGKKLDT